MQTRKFIWAFVSLVVVPAGSVACEIRSMRVIAKMKSKAVSWPLRRRSWSFFLLEFGNGAITLRESLI